MIRTALSIFVLLFCQRAFAQSGPAPQSEARDVLDQDLATLFLNLKATLPDKVQKILLPDGPMAFEYSLLNSNMAPSNLCSDKVILAKRTGPNKITVSQILAEIPRSEEPSSQSMCFYNSIGEITQGALIRLFAYDLDRRHHFSRNKRFAKLASGQARAAWSGRDELNNFNRQRSPRTSEFLSLQESFATNLEYYLLDEGFPCRRPAFTRFYDSIFDLTREQGCAQNKSILVHSQHPQDHFRRIEDISNQTVYEIHYLHADKGTNFASRWGHSMFRLITCAPHRKEIGPDCLDDTAHHLVLSYRGKISELSTSYWKGLNGKYPSQLFIFSMSEIIQEYTRLEFRALKSIPLDFSQEEIGLFLDVSLERYWSYQGQYLFLSNHCGTESLKHLEAVDEERSNSLNSKTPRSLAKTIMESEFNRDGLSEREFDSMIGSPYYFPSKKDIYQSAFDSLAVLNLFEQTNLEDFLEKSSYINRRTKFESLLTSKDVYQNLAIGKKRKLLTRLLLLERLIKWRELRALMDQAVTRTEKLDSDFIESVNAEIQAFSISPWELIQDDNYGVPNRAYLSNYLSKRKDEGSGMAMILEGSDLFSDLYREVNELLANEEMLKNELARILDL